jgi:hypothetical protein
MPGWSAAQNPGDQKQRIAGAAWPLSVRVRLHRQQQRAITRQNMRKSAQMCLRKPFLMLIWEIVWRYLLLFVTFPGFDLDEKGKFLGICLEESHPPKPTFGGQMQPHERTFARFAAPAKPTFRLISLGFSFPAAKDRRQSRQRRLLSHF